MVRFNLGRHLPKIGDIFLVAKICATELYRRLADFPADLKFNEAKVELVIYQREQSCARRILH